MNKPSRVGPTIFLSFSALIAVHGFAGFLWYAVDPYFALAMGIIALLCMIPSWIWMEYTFKQLDEWREERELHWWVHGDLPDYDEEE